ncbi:MAG: response regulator [Thermodesulfobacteriota bacterium]
MLFSGDTNISSAKVLIVEDREDLSASIKTQLQSAGYQVLPVLSSGDEAVRIAESSRPDIVPIDLEIGGTPDGIESGDRISETLGIPVIFLAGYADDKALNRAKTKKPSGYLVKPFNQAELKAVIEIALYKHRPESCADSDTKDRDGFSGAHEAETSVTRFDRSYPVEAYRQNETSNTGSTQELKELKIESLNRSLSQMYANEESVLLAEEDPARSDNNYDPSIEFESE